MAHLTAMIRSNTLQAADRNRLSVYTRAPAGRLTRSIAGSAEDPGKDVRLTIEQIGVGEAPLRDEADVLRNVGVGGTRPLTVDDLVEIVGIGYVGRLHGPPL